MKTKIEIKSRIGNLLFTYESENATIKVALLKAIESGVDLSVANLSGVDLSEANLSGVNLSRANLSRANLSEANLSRAIKIPIFCKWGVGITENNLINIGCKKMTIKEWDLFFNSDKEFETKRNTEQFKQIQATYEAYKAYLTFLNT